MCPSTYWHGSKPCRTPIRNLHGCRRMIVYAAVLFALAGIFALLPHVLAAIVTPLLLRLVSAYRKIRP